MKKLLIILMGLLLVFSVNAARLSVRPTYGYRNQEEEILVQVYNYKDDDLEDVQVSLYIPDLNVYRTSSNFDVDDNEVYGQRFFIDMPAKRGYYPIEISLYGDNTRDVKWTWISVW
jgi:hypothetical protein